VTGERLLKARDVAELLGLEMSTVLDRFQRGELPGFRLGGKGGPVRFRLSEIEEWLETSCRPSTISRNPHKSPAAPKRPGHGSGGERSSATRILRPVRHD
jgi:excisionase family DNA binding protein